MQPYFARPRLVSSPNQTKINYPCRVALTFFLRPEGLFGVNGPYGESVPEGANASMTWDHFKSKKVFTASAIIPPLNTTCTYKGMPVTISGNSVTVILIADSNKKISVVADDFLYCFPSVLSLYIPETPSIYEIRGVAGSVEFFYDLHQSAEFRLSVITKPIQEKKLIDAIGEMEFFGGHSGLKHRRLLAALQYFFVSSRLSRTDNYIYEFLAETILNYGKILETLFPTSGQIGSMDAARVGLKDLGFSDDEIEALYIPALALRNQLDVAHPTLCDLPINALLVLQNYTDSAEAAFKRLLKSLLQQVQAGTYSLKPITDNTPSKDTLRTIKRMEDAMNAYNANRKEA